MDLNHIKEANPIEDVIDAEYTLRGHGRYLRAQAHDSLIIDTHNQAYFWNSQGEQGDVITWVMTRRRCDFKGAIEWLCQRAGLPAPRWNGETTATQSKRAQYDALTVAARHFVRVLRGDDGQVARNYCYSRGWTDETIREAGLGYVHGDRKALLGEFSMHEINQDNPGVQAALGIQAGMLIYPHVEAGRVVYLSARSIEGKRHYNPPTNLIGERRVYRNWLYSPRIEEILVVEGQADAVTCGQWGLAAIALAGVSINQTVLMMLARHRTVYVALDQDETGIRATREIADALGPLTRVITWPGEIQDANEWLQTGATEEDARELLAAAPPWIEALAQEASQAEGADREAALRRVFTLATRMDEFATATYRERLADALGVGIRQFNGMLKAMQEETPSVEEPLITIELPGGMIGGNLVELIYQPPEGTGMGMGDGQGGGKTLFAVRREDETIEIVSSLDVNGIRYAPLPPQNRILSERVVHFPTALGKEKTTRELVQLIREIIHKYVDVDVFYETLAAYYVLFSWLYDSFNTVPYLRCLGDAGTGKSRFIQVVGAMCYRPIYVSGAATVSPIFRILDRYRGTLVLDEADFGRSDEAADIVKILNTGYQRTQGTVLRAGDRNVGFEPEVFVVYGPKVIATRRRFQDWALESRCLTKEMGGPTTREDIPIDLPMSFWTEEAPAVRNLLLRHRLQHWRPQIELDYSDLDMSIEPRLNQVTVALVTLVDDEDLREDLRAFIREYNRQLIVERGMTVTSKVLEVIVALGEEALAGGEQEPNLPLAMVAERVNWLIDWENHGEKMIDFYGKKAKRPDKGVTPKKIGWEVRNRLHLRTERGTRREQRGYQVMWDPIRVKALKKRFGIDDITIANTLDTIAEVEKLLESAGEDEGAS